MAFSNLVTHFATLPLSPYFPHRIRLVGALLRSKFSTFLPLAYFISIVGRGG